MTAGVIDEYPRLFRSKKVMITAVLCIIQFLLGIQFCLQVILYCLIASQQKQIYIYSKRLSCDYRNAKTAVQTQKHSKSKCELEHVNKSEITLHMWSKPKTYKESLSIYFI